MDIPANWPFDVSHDGGDLACGQLLLDLHLRFKDLPPGTRVVVRSVDPGAPLEIPAWCRLIGHKLLDESHPYYRILRGDLRNPKA